jgi:catechol 2,3-dioxygenase
MDSGLRQDAHPGMTTKANRGNRMPVPTHIFDPPFNIIRSSHAVLDVTDLNASREFYENTVGLHVEDRDDKAVYLRGSEEHQHHSLVLRKAVVRRLQPARLQGRQRGDLDKAAAFFSENGITYAFAEQPFQGRTLQFTDPFGFRSSSMPRWRRRPHLLRRYDLYKGCHPQRLDHFNVFAAEVQDTVDFYARLGFRLTEYGEEDGPNGRIAAAWMHRKGNVHDFAITNGKGPRLHHFAYWVPTAMNILHLCDVMASSGFLKNIERGPGRHGISNAFFLYVRDPDGHRLELYTSDYFTMDHDHEPMRWSLKDPRRQTLWGAPAPRSWFEQGSPFPGQAMREPLFRRRHDCGLGSVGAGMNEIAAHRGRVVCWACRRWLHAAANSRSCRRLDDRPLNELAPIRAATGHKLRSISIPRPT